MDDNLILTKKGCRIIFYNFIRPCLRPFSLQNIIKQPPQQLPPISRHRFKKWISNGLGRHKPKYESRQRVFRGKSADDPVCDVFFPFRQAVGLCNQGYCIRGKKSRPVSAVLPGNGRKSKPMCFNRELQLIGSGLNRQIVY